MDVSIIIVNYNTREMTQNCINSIFEKTKDVEFEVILVDNNSTDGSKEHFENQHNIKYIYSINNLGFGKANNLGAKYALGKYLFLLNSDTLLISDVISYFYKFLENNKQYVCCGANLIDFSGKNAVCHGAFPTLKQSISDIGLGKLYKNYYRNYLSCGMKSTDGNIQKIDYLSGADIFISKKVFDILGGFDERFFMYYEETDMFYRMKELNYKTCLLPEVSIIHLEGGSFKKTRTININRFRMNFTSKVLFYKIHRNPIAVTIMKIASILCIFSHFYEYKGCIKQLINIILKTK